MSATGTHMPAATTHMPAAATSLRECREHTDTDGKEERYRQRSRPAHDALRQFDCSLETYAMRLPAKGGRSAARFLRSEAKSCRYVVNA
jgi:hypothetical protein